MDFSSMIVGLIFKILSLIFRPLMEYFCGNYKRRVPPIDNDILQMSATKLAQKIRRKELTSEEIIKVYIKRIKAVNPIINAIVEDRFELALEEAKLVDNLIKEGTLSEEELKEKQPLLGVPLTVKESCSLKGMKLTLGSLYRTENIAEEDGEPIDLLKKAGAIPLLISNTPEYLLCWHTSNKVTGLTKNPYNPAKSAGGSSGGEGALLGAGASVIGVGSDLGGSVRIPAALNGVFSHKPSKGLISIKNHHPTQTIEKANEIQTVGPMCRYVEDLPLMVQIMSGDKDNKYKLNDPIDLSKIKVFFMQTSSDSFFQTDVQKEIKAAILRAVLHLRENCKSKIKSHKFNELYNSPYMIVPRILIYDAKNKNANVGIKNPKDFHLFGELLKILTGKSKYSLQLWYFQMLIALKKCMYRDRLIEFESMIDELRENMQKYLGESGVFIYPNFPMAAFPHCYFPLATSVLSYTMIFNVLGFPSTAVPMGLDSDGLPIGIQVIAGPNQDHLCLAVAKELSKLSGWIPPS